MKTNLNNLDNSEKNRILEMHKKHGYSMYEQRDNTNTPRYLDKLPPEYRDDGRRLSDPGMEDDTKPAKGYKDPNFVKEVVTLDGSLFKNGIADIDKNNTQFKDAIDTLKRLPAGEDVKIIGGASAVGSKEGFNNQKLAELRASNFIKAAKEAGVVANLTPSGKVGVSTVKDSPAAEKEQFVKIDYSQTTIGRFKPETAIDNTSVDKRIGGNSGREKDSSKLVFRICLQDLTAEEYVEIKRRFLANGKIVPASNQGYYPGDKKPDYYKYITNISK